MSDRIGKIGREGKLLPPDCRVKMIGIAFLLIMSCAVLSCSKKPPVAVVEPPKPEVGVPAPLPEAELDRLQQWRALLTMNRYAPVSEKVAAVNRFFNGIEFAEDRYLWGEDDYWATLYETLAKKGGDCEDVAFAKYFTLSRLDIPEERMRITYVMSLKTKKPHMVLICDCVPPSDPLVLDMVNQNVLPVSRRSDLVPVYSFNRNGYFLARKEQKWKGERLGEASRLSLWRDLLKRMEAEGDELVSSGRVETSIQ